VIDGIEFSEIMGKKHPEVQLIMLSSYDKFEYVKTTLLNGASDYILKPTLNPDNLLKVLKKAAAKVPGLELKRQEVMPYASQVEKLLLGYTEKLDAVTFANLFVYTFYRLAAVDLRIVCGAAKEELTNARQIAAGFSRRWDCLCSVQLPPQRGRDDL